MVSDDWSNRRGVLICLALAAVYFQKVEYYRNQHQIKHPLDSVRYILLPPAPMAIAGTFVAITWVDLASWNSVRPVTYFGWVMVAAAGFLMFCLYSGCILLTTNDTICIIGIVFGFITALLFLGDLICLLVSLKRFPAPYWTMKRRHDRMDQCVCTTDYKANQAIIDRPLCRCGDHWDEPCTCDDPDLTCGCGSGKDGKKPPCDSGECTEYGDGLRPQSPDDPPRISTMTGRDQIEDKRKNILTQCTLAMEEDVADLTYCSQVFPGQYCVDSLPDGRRATSILHPRMSTFSEIARQRKSVALSQAPLLAEKSGISMHMEAEGMELPNAITNVPHPGHHYSVTAGNRLLKRSQLIPPSPKAIPQEEVLSPPLVEMDTPKSRRFTMTSQFGEYASDPSNRASISPSKMAGPSIAQAAEHGILNEVLTNTISTPTAARVSKMEPAHPRKPKDSRKSTYMKYSLCDSTIDDKAIASKYAIKENKHVESNKPILRKSIFHDASEKPIQLISKLSSDDEYGEGDYGKKGDSPENKKGHSKDLKLKQKYSTDALLESIKKADSEIRYQNDMETHLQITPTSLPGRVEWLDERGRTYGYKSGSPRKHSSVSAKARTPRKDSSTQVRSKSSVDSLGAVKHVRNVSTTVKAVRTLSRVMEAENEAKSAEKGEEYSSSSTITIKKPHK
ncbi:uncharacterized protein LOC126737125 isoform X2 [Anthonomus grandis grandis]|uniref:uncharacterized protein LOC126737125 isoform X2 n=1 Tax=Anthonomus grandis grandis TaxID=2921223 RepID=UPI002165FB1D|nr:uncharacterized protein LOC126737125 isoform X2 [Anthonomus grandis grandis]